MIRNSRVPVLALTQGDPAGVGPELLVKFTNSRQGGFHCLLVAERAALEQAQETVQAAENLRFAYKQSIESRSEIVGWDENDGFLVFDPVGVPREVACGESGVADARAAVSCLEAGVDLASQGIVDAIVTAPVSKYSIATHCLPEFRGQTEFVAERVGRGIYGRDYLMTFLSSDLQVALLTTHKPLAEVVVSLSEQTLVEAIVCLHQNAGGRIAVAGLNPHAGEGGILGAEEEEIISPAIEKCRKLGVDVTGPESADSLFSRARQGKFDWVLAIYHDQGLIPVKTVSFGSAANWTLGLPFIRTSVDHGTAFDIAGRGRADVSPLKRVVEITRELIAGRLPRGGG